MPLGLEDFRIDSGALTASSYVNYNHGPDRARLNWPSGHSRSGAWVAKDRNTNQWLQVELAHPAKITGVATQGRYDAYQWVTTYAVSHGMDGKTFKAYLEYGRNKVLPCVLLTDIFNFEKITGINFRHYEKEHKKYDISVKVLYPYRPS